LFLLAALAASCAASRAQQENEPAQAFTFVVTTQALPARTKPVAAARPAQAPAPPVVAVVHRLSGWKLRAVVAPPDAPFASTFDDKFVRTNIVAGYVMPDGRSVVARLPQADSDVLSLAAQLSEPRIGTTSGGPSLTLVRADGAEFEARFVGLDGSTGLSLFEASRQLLPPSKETPRPLVIGQRVCVWAPLPSGGPTAELAPAQPRVGAMPSPGTAPPAADPPSAGAPPGAASTRPPDLVGEEGVLYMNLGEIEGTLREVRRSPSGRAVAFSVETSDASPEWSGGVALSESNALVGIVDQSGGRETRLVPAGTVRAAAARVLARRSSVPQPWLGARGDAVARTPPDALVARGWPREQATSLVRRRQGVLLTSVAPGSPAARAGLRPGDVIARVGALDVRGVEDMTWVLKEVGGNSAAQFMVLRAGTPLNVRVLLSEAQSPAAATARAELSAAQTKLSHAQLEMSRISSEMQRFQDEMARIQRDFANGAAAHNSRASEGQLRAVREKLREIEVTHREASLTVSQFEREIEEAQSRLRAAASASPAVVGSPLLPLGAETRMFLRTVVVAGREPQSLRGLIVVSVRPDSAAARADLHVGDVIETVNDEPSLAVDWRAKLARIGDAPISVGVVRDGRKLTLKLNPSTEK
jgi:S1-C subfamily serine protease